MSNQPLEPRIESSLLYTKPDGMQAFVHDSYRDHFLAKYFADRVNDGRLSTIDFYINYLYCLDKSFKYPDHHVAKSIVRFLDNQKIKELVDAINQIDAPLPNRILLLEVLSSEKVIPIPLFSKAFLEILDQLYINYVCLKSNLGDTLYNFVTRSSSQTYADRPTSESLELGRIIAKELEQGHILEEQKEFCVRAIGILYTKKKP